MFIVVLAQLERQPLKKKRHFVNGCVPINVALVFLKVWIFFSFPCSFIILSLRKYKGFCVFL